MVNSCVRVVPSSIALVAYCLVVMTCPHVFGDDWRTQTKLTASDGMDGDQFGYSVAISGDAAIVGATAGDRRDPGTAYIFYQDGDDINDWDEMAVLTASDTQDENRFGRSVAILDETAIVGAVGPSKAPGAAYIFERNMGGVNNWGEVAKLTASDGAAGDRFGQSIAMFGNTVLVGAYYDDDAGSESGSVYVFDRNEGGASNWGEVAKLTASDAGSDDRFGRSVSISGDTVIIGAYLNEVPGPRGSPGSRTGAAYIFERDEGGTNDWSQLTKLTADDPGERDWFGFTVSVSEDNAIIGSPRSSPVGGNSGSAYIFGRDEEGVDNWGQVAKLIPDDAEVDDQFGRSVAILGDTAIVGARFGNGGSGSAYVFNRNEGGLNNWGQVAKLTEFDATVAQPLGYDAIAISGESAIVGAPRTVIQEDRVGSAYIFGTAPPVTLAGGGQTLFEDFDSMSTQTGRVLPNGWSAQTGDEVTTFVSSLGLIDGSLESMSDPLNLGGSPRQFSSSADHVPVWSSDVTRDRIIDDLDVVSDSATDRALGIGRAGEGGAGSLWYNVEITDAPLRAFSLSWDLEIWGGDPDARFRGSSGGGFEVGLSVGGENYYDVTESLKPGELFDTTFDGGSSGHNTTLIDGNTHSIRDITSGVVEVSDIDGAVGNQVSLYFDANFGNNDKGWISAVDNVRLRTIAPGDADANGVVDVADLLTLLGGQKFNQGVDGVTWGQGDFNADDQFNTGDLLAMLSFLSGTFPSDPYASEAGGANDAVADVIVNSETGEVTVDLAGHTVSAVIIESANEIFNGQQPEWDTTSQFPSTLPGELGNVLFTSTASGVDELGVVISNEFLGRDKEFYLQDLDFSILVASEGGTLTKGNVIVVPEPSTCLLLLFGSLALAGVVRGRVTR